MELRLREAGYVWLATYQSKCQYSSTDTQTKLEHNNSCSYRRSSLQVYMCLCACYVKRTCTHVASAAKKALEHEKPGFGAIA